jgi:hypothetical protein
MATTFTKIAAVTVGSGGAATIDFSSIPSTYTDLTIKLTARSSLTQSGINIRFNSDSGANYSWRRLIGSGSATFSDSNVTYGSPFNTYIYLSYNALSTYTANTFASADLYVPNYAGSNSKSFSADMVNENNATEAYAALTAGLWSSSSVVNAISLEAASGTFVQYSTAVLYGINKS